MMFHNVLALVAAALIPSTSAQNLDTFDPNAEPVEDGYCGWVVRQNLEHDESWFYASDVIQCLTSIPFNQAVATRFLTYYNQSLQFQSNSAYIRNPPAGYQQPAFDIFGALQAIQDKVDQSFYRNQYAFEADIQRVSLAMHDAHAVVYAGVLNVFEFAAPFQLVSISSDGTETPKIYMLNDDGSLYNPAISTIDGLPVVDFIEQFAVNQSFGTLEPDADWNQIVITPAQSIQGTANPFSGGANFYPGDYMTVQYEGSTEEPEYWPWLAYYNSPGFTGPLETGGDFYNLFVLDNPPANFDSTFKAYLETHKDYANPNYKYNECPSAKSWHDSAKTFPLAKAYPEDTLNHQKCLGVESSGFVTSYYLSDIKTAILSIPSFDEYGQGIGTFSAAVNQFVQKAKDQAAESVIIDLQQNTGGLEALAFDTYYAFFPGQSLFAGSRIRSHPLANELGTTLTARFQRSTPSDLDYDDLVYEEWVVTDRINAQTGHNFASWAEFYGPVQDNGDQFSLTEQYNITNQAFDNDALGVDFASCFYHQNCTNDIPWSGDKIVLLTDGVCSSSCTLFVELMTQNVEGVRTVVVGGRPQPGPMQAASGSRGARMYSGEEIDGDIWMAQRFDPAVGALYTSDTGMANSYIGLNLRDQMRKNATVPNQFLYLPADCRLYWTLANWDDYGQLWHDVYSAMYNDSSKCVEGSVNATAPITPGTSQRMAKRSAVARSSTSMSEYIRRGISGEHTLGNSQISPGGYLDGGTRPSPVTFCDSGPGTKQLIGKCNGAPCQEIVISCQNCTSTTSCKKPGKVTRFVCMDRCTSSSSTDTTGTCGSSANCRPVAGLNTNQQSSVHNFGSGTQQGASHSNPRYRVASGICVPPTGNGHITCKNVANNRFLQNYLEDSLYRRR